MSALLWAMVTACIWGVVPLIEKWGLDRSDPVTGVFARSVGVFVGLAVFGLLWSPWQALGRLSARSFVLLALGGFLASFVGQLTFYHALKHGQLSQITPVAGTYPLVAALLGWWILREPFSVTRLLGAFLVVSGIWLLRR